MPLSPKDFDIGKLADWIQKQGIAIAILTASVIGLVYYCSKQDDRILNLETKIDILNAKLIECEQSKLLMMYGKKND